MTSREIHDRKLARDERNAKTFAANVQFLLAIAAVVGLACFFLA